MVGGEAAPCNALKKRLLADKFLNGFIFAMYPPRERSLFRFLNLRISFAINGYISCVSIDVWFLFIIGKNTLAMLPGVF